MEEEVQDFVHSLGQDYFSQKWPSKYARGLISLPVVFLTKLAPGLEDMDRWSSSPITKSFVSFDPNCPLEGHVYDEDWLQKLKEELSQ